MTYHLASFRLRSVGERSARFTDLTLDTTQPRDGVRCPADSVFWLRNGGGKSSLLSLFYALILPRVVDFMGRAVKRSLTDYIDTSDTSHTIAVWHPTSGAMNLLGEPDQVLITGAVYEWADLRRPADADKARDRLHADYYAFYALPGVLDASSLPVEDADGQPLRRSTFLAALREFADQHPQALELIITDKQHVWQTELVNRGLDPEVFRTQKEMNHVEGGVEDLFRFPSTRAFIDFLLDLTVAPEAASSVADRLSDIANVLATKPALATERDFCIEMVSGLDRVQIANDLLHSTRENAALAAKQAIDLAGVFAATVNAGEHDVVGLIGQREPLQQMVSRLNGEVSQTNDLAYLYRLTAAELRVAAAEAAFSTAREALTVAAHAADAWAATGPLAELAGLRAAVQRTRAEMDTERDQSRPYIVEHDEHAARLRQRLTALAHQQDATAQDQDALAAAALAVSGELRRVEKQAYTDASNADAAASAAATRLAGLGEDLDRAHRDGWLPSADSDPAGYGRDLAIERERLNRTLATVQERCAARPEQRALLSTELARRTGERTGHDNERARLDTQRGSLQRRADTLAGDPRIGDVVEADPSTTVDLWAEADMIHRRLTDAVRHADEDLVREEALSSDDIRLLDTHARTGVLPTSLDADRVRHVLNDAGVDATPGWTYLRENIPPGHYADALTEPDIARLGCGVIIPTDRAADAASTLQHLDVTTIALVGVYTVADAGDLTASVAALRPTWTALNSGLLDEAAASTAAERAGARRADHEARQRSVISRRDADRALLHDLRLFLADCPAGHLVSLSRRVADLDLVVAEDDRATADITTALSLMEIDEAEDRNAEQRLTTHINAVEQAINRLDELAARAQQAAGWAMDQADAEGNARRARDRATNAALSAEAQRDSAHRHAYSAKTAREAANAHRIAHSRVRFLEAEPGPVADDPSETLDVLTSRRDAALRAHEVRVGDSVLEERLRNDEARLATVEGNLARTATAVLATARDFLLTSDGQTDESRLAARTAAGAAVGDAATAVGRAEAGVATAQTAAQGIRKTRASIPTRRLPIRPDEPAEADLLAAEQEQAAQQIRESIVATEVGIEALDRQQSQVETRIRDFKNLLEDLPTPVGDGWPTYPGDDTEARDDRRLVMAALERLRTQQQNAESQLALAVNTLRTKAAAFVTVTVTAKDRIMHDVDHVIADQAERRLRDLTIRASNIEGLLAGIDRDQAVVANDLAHLVKLTLDTLRKAERHSMLPKSLGEWAGKPMLTIRFDAPATDSDLRTYVNRVIERRIGEGVKAEGLPLLKDAVHEAVGPAGFKVKVLKPTEDVASTREDITRLGKWSGGEKLTVCVALYCTIAALRSANSPRRDRSGGGVLLLDNPIGRASHGSLVMLQRNVAAAHGVQLIYTTGVKDPDAVSRFPNVVRLDNRAGRTRNRRYIVENPVIGQEDVTVAHQIVGVRIAHDDTRPDITYDDSDGR